MLFRLVPIAVLAIVCGAFSANSQSVRDIPAPRETPPSSFKGAQYVDSRGCVFVRAGVDGKVAWIPRVDASRKVLCGYPPTMAAMSPAVEPEVVIAPTSEPETTTATAAVPQVRKPAKKKVPVVSAATVAPEAATSQGYVDTPRSTSVPGQLACPGRAPLAKRFALQGGGTVVLCLSRENLLTESSAVSTTENADLIDARAPMAARTELVCPRSAPVAQRLPRVGGGATILCTTGLGGTANLAIPVRRVTVEAAVIEVSLPQEVSPALPELVVPKGYKPAWKDGRLNPKRGQGTASGQLAQDQIWTREVPARLVSEVAVADRDGAKAANKSAPSPLIVSTKSEARKGTNGILIQVGSFAQTKNAQHAGVQIRVLGLPAAIGQLTRGGKLYQVVFAGPFASEEMAGSALTKLRRNGFPDSVIR
jgi:hypothetical protein